MTPLRPADITQRTFRTVEIGYDPGQVRAFLSMAAQAFEELNTLDPFRRIENQVAAILAEARSVALSTIDRALDEAVRTRRETQAALDDLTWSAKAEASRRLQEALEKADEILNGAAGSRESRTDAAIELKDEMQSRLLHLHGVIENGRRIGNELQGLQSISSELLAFLESSTGPKRAPTRVVIVSTLNRFRSPVAQEILKREAAALGIENLLVSSCGTDAPLGHAAPSRALNWASRLGINLATHRSKPLSRRDVALADLVVVMERRHAEAVRELHPWAKVVLLGDLRESSLDFSVPAKESFGVLAQYISKRDGREISEPRTRVTMRSYARCVEEMIPYLRALAQFLARLEHDAKGYRQRHYRFQDVATEKGELDAADS